VSSMEAKKERSLAGGNTLDTNKASDYSFVVINAACEQAAQIRIYIATLTRMDIRAKVS